MNKRLHLAPCSGKDAYGHYENTIDSPISVSDFPSEIRGEYQLGKAYPVWGITSDNDWKQVHKNDVILFYTGDDTYSSAAEVDKKLINQDWGEELWPDYDKEPWKNLVILKNIQEIELSKYDLNPLLNYKHEFVPRGFMSIKEDRVENLYEKFDSLEKFIDQFSSGSMEQGNIPQSNQESNLQEIAESFWDYLSANGFYFEKDEVKNFVLSLKTKPFVLLAGISGTGKTKLASEFAEFVGQDPYIISVKPNWTDHTDLLGYQDLDNQFRKQTLTEVLIKANEPENRNTPHFVILDEMNLARVEHYFSEFLSKMETRKVKEDGVSSEPIFEDEFVSNLADKSREELRDLPIPDNLYIIGTVNMDETTNPFSRKVLDRANSLEFNDVKLDEVGFSSEAPEYVEMSNEVLESEYLRLKDVYNENESFFDDIIDELSNINDILRRGDFQFGYRVRDELCIYVYYAVNRNLFDKMTALDFQIKQKILPRLQGSTDTIQEILRKLYEVTYTDEDRTFDKDWRKADEISAELEDVQKQNHVHRFPRSAKKILRMQRRYLEQAFTSFWI